MLYNINKEIHLLLFDVHLYYLFFGDRCKRLSQNTIKVPLQQCCIMGMNAAGKDPGVQTHRVLRL